MAELHNLPNVEYLHTIEDEIYQYAVEHPEECLDTNMEEGSHEFSWKMSMLYRQPGYNETFCENRDKARRGEKGYGPSLDYSKKFIEKHPQWKKLYYY
jgi:hypothetical protein